MRSELEKASIGKAQINELHSKIEQNLTDLESLEFSPQAIATQIEPFENILASILDIKAGLRLRRNVGSQIDLILQEVKTSSRDSDIASSLGLDVNAAKKSENEINTLLNDIQSKELGSVDELIDLYKGLQNSLLRFRESVGILKANIHRNWLYQETGDSRLIIIVPKVCSTDNTINGLLVLQKVRDAVDEISITIDGVLLEFGTDRKIHLTIKDGSDIGTSFFSFVGKRPGRGKVILRSENVQELQNGFDFPVKIIPRISEIAQESLMFSIPVGGIALLIFWGLGKSPKDYASITAAVGGVFGLLLFLIRYFKTKRIKNTLSQ